MYANPAVETQVPADFFKLAGSKDTDIHYWTQVLPEQDRKNKKYIVVPSSGLVVPIGEYEKDSSIFQTMIDGREADVMPALQKGALEYPGTSANGYGEV